MEYINFGLTIRLQRAGFSGTHVGSDEHKPSPAENDVNIVPSEETIWAEIPLLIYSNNYVTYDKKLPKCITKCNKIRELSKSTNSESDDAEIEI